MIGKMAEWSIASDLKSDELYRFREFESHSLLLFLYKIDYNKGYKETLKFQKRIIYEFKKKLCSNGRIHTP